MLGFSHDAVNISFSLSVVLYTSIAVINYQTVALSRIVCLLSCSLCWVSPSHHPQPVVADGCPFLSLVLPEVSSCLLIGGHVTAGVSI